MFYDLLLQLVLLLSAMSEQPLEQFATTEAIQCTEIYEFVQRLASKEYELPHLQVRDLGPVTGNGPHLTLADSGK